MHCTRHEYSTTDADLPLALARVEADALAFGLSQRTALTLVLMLEELYTNLLKYGLRCAAHAPGDHTAAPVRSDADAPQIVVELFRQTPGEVELLFEDGAAAHDPFAAIDTAQLDASADDRPVGRLGLLLLRRLALHADYEYRGGRNRVRLCISTDASPVDFQAP